MTDQNIALMAHLMRRAGFDASREEIETRAAQGYDATVEELLNPESQPGIDEDLLFLPSLAVDPLALFGGQ